MFSYFFFLLLQFPCFIVIFNGCGIHGCPTASTYIVTSAIAHPILNLLTRMIPNSHFIIPDGILRVTELQPHMQLFCVHINGDCFEISKVECTAKHGSQQ